MFLFFVGFFFGGGVCFGLVWFGYSFMFFAQKLVHQKERQLVSKSHSGHGCVLNDIRQGPQKMATL